MPPRSPSGRFVRRLPDPVERVAAQALRDDCGPWLDGPAPRERVFCDDPRLPSDARMAQCVCREEAALVARALRKAGLVRETESPSQTGTPR